MDCFFIGQIHQEKELLRTDSCTWSCHGNLYALGMTFTTYSYNWNKKRLPLHDIYTGDRYSHGRTYTIYNHIYIQSHVVTYSRIQSHIVTYGHIYSYMVKIGTLHHGTGYLLISTLSACQVTGDFHGEKGHSTTTKGFRRLWVLINPCVPAGMTILV